MIVVTIARKPIVEGSVAANVMKHDCGGLDIDSCRIRLSNEEPDSGAMFYRNRGVMMPLNRHNYFRQHDGIVISEPLPGGRWPANLILEHLEGCLTECQGGCPVVSLDSDAGVRASGNGNFKRDSASDTAGNRGSSYGAESRPAGAQMVSYGDRGSASRFFKQVGGQR